MKRSAGPQWTKRKLLEQMVLGSRQQPLVGSAESIADALIAWTTDADVDGFNLSRTVAPECFVNSSAWLCRFCRNAVSTRPPMETARYADRLPPSHPAAAYRPLAAD